MRQRLRTDRQFDDGLTRLGDSEVTEWLSDYTQPMSSRDWYGGDLHPSFGNFWAKRPCRIRSHKWHCLGESPYDKDGINDDSNPRRWWRYIWRCQRCGSQVHQALSVGPTPSRGRI